MGPKQNLGKTSLSGVVRKSIRVCGVVQGVGFRPSVYRLAKKFNLAGWVENDMKGVLMEVEGPPDRIDAFIQNLLELPPPVHIREISVRSCRPENDTMFIINRSRSLDVERSVLISPDLATCEKCLAEIFDPTNRRYRYAFTNCTHCGPRYTIITDVPYDRKNTTMQRFKQCPLCEDEYSNPGNRRFHAQPNACPTCGPRLVLMKADGTPVSSGDPIQETIRVLERGFIVAVKGLGGFHIACDAGNERVVSRLRKQKYREDKAFALMCRDVEVIRRLCHVDRAAIRLLKSAAAPIVILKKKAGHDVAPSVAPHHGTFGVMLPYTPLHYLLFQGRLDVLVMTSGNITDEPVIYHDDIAVKKLSRMADYFLVHDRPIVTRCDDSVIRMDGRLSVFIRRSRGFVPEPISMPVEGPPVMGCGAELKNTFCITRGSNAFLSEYIGDLKNADVYASYKTSYERLVKIFNVQPGIIAHDLHPDYFSSRFAQRLGKPLIAVQHHFAHALSCMAENGLTGEVLAVVMDGSGLGSDGTVWGGEFLSVTPAGFKRLAYIDPVPLPGGDAAVLEPWRMAMVYLDLIYKDRNIPDIPFLKYVDRSKWQILKTAIDRNINAPVTSSAGRLFDAVSALLGIRRVIHYEGQAAIELEQIIETECSSETYPFKIRSQGDCFILDPKPAVKAVVEALRRGEATGVIAASFHETFAEMILAMLLKLKYLTSLSKIVLSGGVFQNTALLGRLVEKLENRDFMVYTHRQVPSNDGGISLGQAYHALAVGRT